MSSIAGRDSSNERLGVLGWPIAHSLSPAIHSAAYQLLGLPWRYSAVRCGTSGLAPFLRGRDDSWRGLSLTMPLKEEAHRIAVTHDAVASESRIVNTLLRQDDGEWVGFNTDVAGLAAAIRNAGLDASRTLVIGSGATAVSAILAARSLGAEAVGVLARNLPAMTELVARFDGSQEPGQQHVLRVTGAPIDRPGDLLREWSTRSLSAPSLVISTLPGTVSYANDAQGPRLLSALTEIPLFDVAYDPWPSPLATLWHERGGVAYPGAHMLVEQGVLQVRIFMNGDQHLPLPDEASVRAAMMRAAGLRA